MLIHVNKKGPNSGQAISFDIWCYKHLLVCIRIIQVNQSTTTSNTCDVLTATRVDLIQESAA